MDQEFIIAKKQRPLGGRLFCACEVSAFQAPYSIQARKQSGVAKV